MSTYYSAYLGKKTKDGIYEIIGPYIVNKDGKSELSYLWWRSQSFIRWREWDTYNIPIEKLGREARNECAIMGIFSEEEYSCGFWISAKEIYTKGSCSPVRGYLPIDEAAELIASNYDQDYISWSMVREPISAEVLAGMSDSKRNEYSFVSYIDYESTEYHMWELGRILNGYNEFSLLEEGEELGIIFRVG